MAKEKNPTKEIPEDTIKQIEQNAVDKYLANLNLASLFQMQEEQGILTKIIPYVNLGFLFIILILSLKK